MKFYRVLILFSLLAIVVPSSGLNSRKLEGGSLTPGVEKKCAGCSCNGPCGEVPPPPPPPSPPPSTKYPPPPSGESGGSINYPNVSPPPSEQSVYIDAPPGNDLYPVNPYYTKNGASPGFASFGFPAFIGTLLLGFLAFN